MSDTKMVKKIVIRKKPKVEVVKKKKRNNKNMGRPTVFTPEVVTKIEKSLQNGFTIGKACHLAGISTMSYYREIERNQDFCDNMKRAQEWAVEKARQNVVMAIQEGDQTTSRWYLERKAKDEFSVRNEVTGKDGKAIEHNHSIEDMEIEFQQLAVEHPEAFAKLGSTLDKSD